MQNIDMTLYKPSLFVRRFIVSTGSHVGYDERFHIGLNLISGESNSVGKSTIANLLVFGLGADFTKWTPEALSFKHTLVEIDLNGATLTLRREISETRGRPMDIGWGTIDEAIKKEGFTWERLPYRKTENQESFSSILFQLLGLPSIRTDLAGKLTMHQLLRLIFVDQMTPSEQMFRSEQFDSPTLRKEVGAILCGYYSNREYELRDKLREIRDSLQELKTRQKVLNEFANQTDQNTSVLSVQGLLDETRTKLEQAEGTVRKALQEPRSRKQITAEYRRQVDAAELAVSETAHTLNSMKERLAARRFAIEDSREFLDSLDRTLKSLDESESIRDALGELPLYKCPSCHHAIVPPNDENCCALCKEPQLPGDGKTQLLRMRQELLLQHQESTKLQQDNEEEARALERSIPHEEARLRKAQQTLENIRGCIDPAIDAMVGTAYREAGYLQGVVEDLERQLRMVMELEAAKERQADLTAQAKQLEKELEKAETEIAERRSKARGLISSHTVKLLHADEHGDDGIPVEEALAQCHDVDFDFAAQHVFVDGRDEFSASSKVIVKNMFHLALLIASLEDKEFRYPRLLIMDNVEDKGMRPSRSQNFQHLLLSVSKNSEVAHQIIATTSMIADDLRGSEHAIGPYYTSDHKSLSLPETQKEDSKNN